MMTEKFPNLKKETDIQAQEAQRIPNQMNSKRPTPTHIIIKMAKLKIRENSKGKKRKTVTHKGIPINLSADFSAET